MAETTYTHPISTGNRTSLITLETNAAFGGLPTSMINGDINNECYFGHAQQVLGKYILFDFKKKVIIDEATWYQNSATTNGTWRWEGSNDKANWTVLSANIVVGGVRQVMAGINSKLKAYRYYRLAGVTGITNAGPYTQEVQFKAMAWEPKSFVLDKGEYKTLRKHVPSVPSGSAIPIMTSDNTPSGIASASSTHPTMAPYYAFDGISSVTVSNVWHTPISISTGWLAYEFPSPRKIVRYELYNQPAYASDRTPRTWRFEGSVDGVTWDKLDEQTDIRDWRDNVPKSFNISNPGNYKHYRLNILVGAGTSYIGVSEMKMYAEPTPEIPAYWEVISNTLPSVSQFASDGMENFDELSRLVKIVQSEPMATSNLEGELLFRDSINLDLFKDIKSIKIK